MRAYFLFAAVVLTAAAARGADNRLPNSGFEEGDRHWTIGEDVSQIVADAKHSGQKGLRVGSDHYNPAGSSVTSSRLPVAVGQDITVTFWARSTKTAAGVYLFYYTPAGKVTSDPKIKGGFPNCAVKQADGDWHQYTLKTTTPAGVASVAIWVHAYSGSVGITDFDDFAVEGIAADAVPLPPPPKRVARDETASAVKLPPRTKPPVIILKLDDLKQVKGGVPASWQHVADELKSRRIKASFGVICQTLAEATPQYAGWLKERRAAGELEFWFHGWDHGTHDVDGTAYNEFSHRTYAEQKERLDKSQKLALEKLGFAFETFGPPGGVYSASFDASTHQVMQDDPYIKVWLYPQAIDDAGKKTQAAGKVMILDRVWDVNIESSVGVPDFRRFAQGYARHPDRQYFVLQGHPAMWDATRFAEFGKILDFLVAEKAVFMTPAEYAAACHTPKP